LSIESGEYVPLDMLWPACVAFLIFISEKVPKTLISSFCNVFIERILGMNIKEQEKILTKENLINLFMRNINKILVLSGLNEENTEKTLTEIKEKFTITTAPEPIKQQEFFLKLPQNTAKITDQTNLNNQNSKIHIAQIEMLKNELNSNKETLNEVLQNQISHSKSSYKNPINKVSPHIICDKMENFVLSTIKHLILRSKTQEVKDVINWRKQILELAQNEGWELANLVSLKTRNSFKINAIDIIEVFLLIIHIKNYRAD